MPTQADITALEEKNVQVLLECRKLHDDATGKRKLTPAEHETWERGMDEIKRNDALIEVYRADIAKATVRTQVLERAAKVTPGNSGNAGATDESRESLRRFGEYCARGYSRMTPEDIRALNLTQQGSGGALVPPVEWVAEVLKTADSITWVGEEVDSKPMTPGVPQSLGRRTSRLDEFEWVNELEEIPEDDGLSYSPVSLQSHKLAKKILISNDLLNAPGIDAAAEVMAELAYVWGTTHEVYWILGNGTNQPLGFMIDHAMGIPSTYDVSTFNTVDLIEFDCLQKVTFDLKEIYRGNALFGFNRVQMAQIARLKDGAQRYLLQPDVTQAGRMNIWGYRVRTSDFMPSAIAPGARVGIFGDLKKAYRKGTLPAMEIKRMNELYDRTNQTGFHVRGHGAGRPLMAEAVRRICYAAS